MKTDREVFSDLPAGTAIMCRQPIGPTLIKCADNQECVFHSQTGTVHHVDEYLPADLSAENFLRWWEVDPPQPTDDEKLVLQTMTIRT